MIEKNSYGYIFFRKFQELCYENNTSTSAVLRELGHSPTSLKKWREGHGITVDILMEIANYFKVTPNFLLGID